MKNTAARSGTVVISADATAWSTWNWSELWAYRELLVFFTARDLKVRYKQAVLGVFWAVLQPLLSMGVFTIFLGKFAKMPSDGLPYPIFSFAAMMPWFYFAGALSKGSGSLVGSGSLLSKVYFPRVLIPLSAVVSGIVDYAISFLLLMLICLFYHVPFHLNWLWVFPSLTLLTLGLALGCSLWLGSLNVRYRDVSHLLPFGLQLWMFATPVIYPTSIVPEQWRWLIQLNPMSGVIESYRACLLGQPIGLDHLGMSLLVTAFSLITGIWYFLKTEKTFADLV